MCGRRAMKKLLLMLIAMFSLYESAVAREMTHHLSRGIFKTSTMGHAAVTIIKPTTIGENRSLNFGQINKNKIGKITIHENSSRTSTSRNLVTSKPSSGEIKIHGIKGQMVTISVPRTHIFNNQNNTLEYISNIPKNGKIVTLNHLDGTATLNIGGTLNLKKNDIAGGNYSGVYVLQTSY
jgi:hypothetical protein